MMEPDFVVVDIPTDLVGLILRVNEFTTFLVRRLPEIAKLDPVVDEAFDVLVKA